MKSIPVRDREIDLKPFAYKESELIYSVTACLLKNEPTSLFSVVCLIPYRKKAQ